MELPCDSTDLWKSIPSHHCSPENLERLCLIENTLHEQSDSLLDCLFRAHDIEKRIDALEDIYDCSPNACMSADEFLACGQVESHDIDAAWEQLRALAADREYGQPDNSNGLTLLLYFSDPPKPFTVTQNPLTIDPLHS